MADNFGHFFLDEEDFSNEESVKCEHKCPLGHEWTCNDGKIGTKGVDWFCNPVCPFCNWDSWQKIDQVYNELIDNQGEFSYRQTFPYIKCWSRDFGDVFIDIHTFYKETPSDFYPIEGFHLILFRYRHVNSGRFLIVNINTGKRIDTLSEDLYPEIINVLRSYKIQNGMDTFSSYFLQHISEYLKQIKDDEEAIDTDFDSIFEKVIERILISSANKLAIKLLNIESIGPARIERGIDPWGITYLDCHYYHSGTFNIQKIYSSRNTDEIIQKKDSFSGTNSVQAISNTKYHITVRSSSKFTFVIPDRSEYSHIEYLRNFSNYCNSKQKNVDMLRLVFEKPIRKWQLNDSKKLNEALIQAYIYFNFSKLIPGSSLLLHESALHKCLIDFSCDFIFFTSDGKVLLLETKYIKPELWYGENERREKVLDQVRFRKQLLHFFWNIPTDSIKCFVATTDPWMSFRLLHDPVDDEISEMFLSADLLSEWVSKYKFPHHDMPDTYFLVSRSDYLRNISFYPSFQNNARIDNSRLCLVIRDPDSTSSRIVSVKSVVILKFSVVTTARSSKKFRNKLEDSIKSRNIDCILGNKYPTGNGTIIHFFFINPVGFTYNVEKLELELLSIGGVLKVKIEMIYVTDRKIVITQ
ncbi:MAG: hypothetical protein ACFFD4_25000 [Candidatus Odinarchaeota archaeon]